jgi:hypothetical protein
MFKYFILKIIVLCIPIDDCIDSNTTSNPTSNPTIGSSITITGSPINSQNNDNDPPTTSLNVPNVNVPNVNVPNVNVPNVNVPNVNVPSVNLQKSIPTFYFRVGDNLSGCPPVQTFVGVGAQGPCNGGQGVLYNTNSKYWAAINGAVNHCGQQIRVYYNSNNIILTIMDQCPGCGSDNHRIDVGLEALVELTGSVENACAINKPLPEVTWEFI